MNFTKDEQARRRSMLKQSRTGNNQDEAWARSIGVYLTYEALR